MNKDNDLSKKRKRPRAFTTEEKIAILLEAAATSFNSTAQRYKLQPSQLFVWRRKMLSKQ